MFSFWEMEFLKGFDDFCTRYWVMFIEIHKRQIFFLGKANGSLFGVIIERFPIYWWCEIPKNLTCYAFLIKTFSFFMNHKSKSKNKKNGWKKLFKSPSYLLFYERVERR